MRSIGHGRHQPSSARLGQRREHAGDLAARRRVELRERPLAGLGQAEQRHPAVVRRRPLVGDALFVEPGDQAADIAEVEPELAGQPGRRGGLALRDLVDQARRGQAVGTVEQAVLQRTDPPGVEAREARAPPRCLGWLPWP
jgi:hypothetical protein